MRKWVALMLFLGFAWPAIAARTVSVNEMEHLLDSLRGRSDEKVAAEVDHVQLTERVSLPKIALWEVEFPGPRERVALVKLVDLSAFLYPPAADLPRDPAPDIEAQKHILGMAEQYVNTMASRLPDFYAIQVRTSFRDTPHVNDDRSGDGTTDLHYTGEYGKRVTYRDGHEVPFESANAPANKPPAEHINLVHGVFGPILEQIMGDALQSGVRFLRWELESGRMTAVFGYTVPANASHFSVGIMMGDRVTTLFPAYHGEIELDRETGEILRVTEVADMTPPGEAMITIDYAPVPIGPRSYIVPVWAVAFMKSPVPMYNAQGRSLVLTEMDDVAFINFHKFSSTARIVPDWNGQGATIHPNNTEPTDGKQH